MSQPKRFMKGNVSTAAPCDKRPPLTPALSPPSGERGTSRLPVPSRVPPVPSPRGGGERARVRGPPLPELHQLVLDERRFASERVLTRARPHAQARDTGERHVGRAPI